MIFLSRRPLQECLAELLVFGVDSSGRLDAGVGAAVGREAGPALGEALRLALAAGSREPGSVFLTPAYALEERGVKSLALVVTRPVLPTLEGLRKALGSVVHRAREQGCRSLACPALGCGAGALPTAGAAHAILEVLGPASRDGLEVRLALPRRGDYEAFGKIARRLRLALELT